MKLLSSSDTYLILNSAAASNPALMLDWIDGDEDGTITSVSNTAFDFGSFRVMEACSVTYKGTMMIFGGTLNSDEVAIVQNCGLTISSLELPIDMYRHSCLVHDDRVLLCGSQSHNAQCYGLQIWKCKHN